MRRSIDPFIEHLEPHLITVLSLDLFQFEAGLLLLFLELFDFLLCGCADAIGCHRVVEYLAVVVDNNLKLKK